MPSVAFANKPTDGGYWLQDAATPVMEELTKLHNFVFWIILAITLICDGFDGLDYVPLFRKKKPYRVYDNSPCWSRSGLDYSTNNHTFWLWWFQACVLLYFPRRSS